MCDRSALMVLMGNGLPANLQSKPDLLLLLCRQAPHLGSMDPANQHVASNPLKRGVWFEVSSSAVFVYLGGVTIAELRIERFEVTTDFLPRLLEADRSI